MNQGVGRDRARGLEVRRDGARGLEVGRDGARGLRVRRGGARGFGVGRDFLIRLAPSGEVSVGINFLALGILNINTR